MGAVIEAVGISVPKRRGSRGSSISLAQDAARRVLRDASVPFEDVDLVLNTGVYRDENICEPAVAALIQNGIADPRPADLFSTFSFDLNNGACGIVNAFEVMDSFLCSGAVRRGLVVTSDVDPTPGLSEGFGFDSCGAAILMRPGAMGEGFTAFRGETFSKHSDLFESHLDFVGGDRWWRRARSTHAITLRQDEGFSDACVSCAVSALGPFLAARRLDVSEIDLVIASPSPESFASEFAKAAGIAPDRMAGEPANVHTAGPALALRSAFDEGSFASAQNVLFVVAGAGITVALALYTNPS